MVNVKTMSLMSSMVKETCTLTLNNFAFIYLFIKIKWRTEKWLEFLCSFFLMNHTHKVNTLLVKLRYKRRELQGLLDETILEKKCIYMILSLTFCAAISASLNLCTAEHETDGSLPKSQTTHSIIHDLTLNASILPVGYCLSSTMPCKRDCNQ